MIKKLIITLLICSITACSTTHYKGDGIILSKKKISNRDYKPHEGTKTGALVGGTAGVITGAAVGGVFGFVLGAFTTSHTIELVAITLGAGALGALAVGAAGSVVGGGAGYVIDVINHPVNYQYTVQPNYQSDPIIITQYAPLIPVNTKVHILEKDNALYLAK